MFKNELLEDFIALALIIAPVIIESIKRKTFKNFNYRALVTTLNYTLIYVAVIGGVLLATMKAIDNNIDKIGGDKNWADIIMNDGMIYFVFGICLYPIIVVLLNTPFLIKWMIKKSKSSNPH